jgi:nucleoside 2-deoxyribosyltransferase
MVTTHTRIYIAGPMTGRPDFNFPAFHAAAARLRRAGWQVVNPAENFGGRTDLPRATYLRADIVLLAQCDAIALLPGWDGSAGATLEAIIAVELGLRFIDAATCDPMEEPPRTQFSAEHGMASVLDTAKRITEGGRQRDYGHPADDFERTAQMWTAILCEKLAKGTSVTAEDVPLCMIAVKLARQAHRHKRDNLVDIAGYARAAAMAVGEE